MTIPENTLMAHADGELKGRAAAEVEAAIAADPALATRVARYRTQRSQLRAAFEPVLTEPIPSRLVAAARGVPVISQRKRWSATGFVAMAASLLLGIAGTWGVLRPASEPLIVAAGNGLVAQGELARALSEDLSGETGTGPASAGLSFRDQAGTYCRTFELRGSESTAGLACRVADGWQVRLATRAGPDSPATPYRPAGSALPEEVRRAVDASIAGDPLDAGEEGAARVKGWRE